MGPSTKLRLTAAGCVALALMLLVLPLRWILAWCLAAAVHEGCHALAVLLCGGRIDGVTLSGPGAEMAVSHIHGWRELICALAGPLGALLLLLFAKWLPATAVCAIFQSAYNLLPLYPMDGGRALHCLLELFVPRHAVKISRIVGSITIVLLCCGALYAAIWLNLGLMPVLLAVVLYMKVGRGFAPAERL